jgi:hypothetical protein
MGYDIFLSYCRADQNIADEFVKLASAQGLTVWYDRLITGGQDWRDRIVEALASSNCLLILFSEESNASKQLIKELAIADQLGKLVIPVLVQDVQPRGAYLYEMAFRNWINLHPNPASRLKSLIDELLLQLHAEKPIGPEAAPERVVSRIRDLDPYKDSDTSQNREGSAAAPLSKPRWFPLRRYDIFVLGPVLVAGFVLQFSRTPPEETGGVAINIVALVAYMFVLAFRNAKLNRGITSLASFCSYLIVGALILPFGVLPDWMSLPDRMGESRLTEYGGIAAGLILIAFIAALFANVLQVLLRKIFLRKAFMKAIERPPLRKGT